MKCLIAKSTWLGLLAATLVLTACGGGGGGGGFTPPNINETPIAITAANQNAIALSVDEGINGTMDGGDVALGAVVDGGGPTPSIFDFASTKLLDYAKQGAATAANLPAGVMQSETLNCASSGTITFTIDIADPDFLVMIAGDSLSVIVRNCDDGLGDTVNGSFSFTIDSGSIVLDCISSCPDVAIAVNFNNFRITEGMETVAIHGGFTMAVSEIGGTSSLSGTSLYLIAGADAIRLTNFSINSELIAGDTATRSSVNMTIASTMMDGSITMATTVDIDQVIGEDHPYTGTVLVTGAGNAELTINYPNALQVELTLDTDGAAGPTPPETTVLVNWADI
jgi:hypothetical protein